MHCRKRILISRNSTTVVLSSIFRLSKYCSALTVPNRSFTLSKNTNSRFFRISTRNLEHFTFIFFVKRAFTLSSKYSLHLSIFFTSILVLIISNFANKTDIRNFALNVAPGSITGIFLRKIFPTTIIHKALESKAKNLQFQV